MADGDNKVYVLDDGANKHEGMTKSEIMDTIVEMMETGQVTGGIYIDAVKEQNAGESLKFWVGTQAQYEALPKIDPYIDYKITDANTLKEIDAALTQLKEQLTSGAFKVKSAYTADDVQTSINGKAISEIFESDGKTAKKATIATADENGNNIMASYALKDDLQDAEGDIDALEGRMTTAEGDIDALLPTSVTDTNRASGQWAIGNGASGGSFLLGTFRVYDTNISLHISGGIATSAADSTTDVDVFISTANHVVNKAEYYVRHIYTKQLSGLYYTLDDSHNLRVFADIPEYGKFFVKAEVTGGTIEGRGATGLQYPSGGAYLERKDYFATDPSKLAPSTANGWTETTTNGSLPGAGVYLVYACMNKQTVTTNNESSIAMIIYDGQGDDRCATPVMWLSAPAFLVYKNGSWEMKRMDKSEVAQPYRIMYKRIA